MVLFMTTVHTGRETVRRKRHRPTKTATNARTSRVLFGEEAVKELSISEFFDMYNHFMNGVDVADQMRSYYNTQRVHLKNWKPLWHYLLDTAVTNAYKIAYCSPERPWAEHRDHHTHREFRTRLATELFEDSERIGDRKQTPSHGPLSDYVRRALAVDHGPQPIKISEPKKRCMACVICRKGG